MPLKGHRNRTLHDIVTEILKIAKSGERKTRMMYRVGLSYRQLEKYLKALNDSGFIAEKSGVWRTTEKGFNVIEACDLCVHLAKDIDLN